MQNLKAITYNCIVPFFNAQNICEFFITTTIGLFLVAVNMIIHASVTLSFLKNFAFEIHSLIYLSLFFFHCFSHGQLHIYTVMKHLFKVHQHVNINALLLLLFLWFMLGSLFSNYNEYSRSKQCCLFLKPTYIKGCNICCGGEREY